LIEIDGDDVTVVQMTMLLITIVATIGVTSVVLVASCLIARCLQHAPDAAARDVEGDKAAARPLQPEEVLEAAELHLKRVREGLRARSAEASRDAEVRPTDAWVDETLWHTLDTL
jgi:hypothetical protein